MIYLLYDYEEHGPDSVYATTRRETLESASEEYWSNHGAENAEEGRQNLKRLLSLPDHEILGDNHLSRGWGSLKLLVVEPDRWGR